MKTFTFSFPFLLVAGLIVHAQGSFSGFTLWNCLPVAAAFGALLIGFRSQRPLAAACITFSVVAAFLPALFHLAWLFDWGGIATGSSTSGLAFIVVPVWTLLFSAIAAAVAGHRAMLVSSGHLENGMSAHLPSTQPNHALQRTRPSRSGCKRVPSRAGRLSLPAFGGFSPKNLEHLRN